MKVFPILNNLYNVNKNVNFQSNRRHYSINIDNLTENKILTNTWALRNDFEVDNLLEILDSKFNTQKKVDIYGMACSDASEAYSLAILLMEKFGLEKSKKFLPIIINDMDKEIIDFVKSGYWNLSDYDIIKFKNRNIKMSKYIDLAPKKITIADDITDYETRTYVVKDVLKNAVTVNHCTIKQQIPKINNDSKSLVLCRNVFPYMLCKEEINQTVKDLSNALKEGSYVHVGVFDDDVEIDRILKLNKFLCIKSDSNIYVKTK